MVVAYIWIFLNLRNEQPFLIYTSSKNKNQAKRLCFFIIGGRSGSFSYCELSVGRAADFPGREHQPGDDHEQQLERDKKE